MALDLTLQITADASQAKAELRAVENAVTRVETASTKSQPAIAKVTDAFSGQGRELSKVEQAFAKAEAAVLNAERSSAKLSGTTVQATSALSGMGTGSADLTTRLMAMTGAAGLSVTSIAALSVGVGAAAAAVVGLSALIIQSTSHYIEHSKAAAGLRGELDHVSDTWSNFQMIVGAAVMQGEQAPLIAFLKLAEGWALQLGVKIAADIMLVKELVNSMPGMGLARGVMSATDPGAIPDPSRVLGGPRPLGSLFGQMESGAYRPMSGDQAWALYLQDQAAQQKADREKAKAAKEAAAEAKREEKALAAELAEQAKVRYEVLSLWSSIRNVPTTGIGTGISGLLASHIFMGDGAKGFSSFGTPREDFIGAVGLDPSKLHMGAVGKRGIAGLFGDGSPSLGARISGSLGSDMGQMLTRLLVERGSAGSGMGSAIGGSIFGSLMEGGSGKAIGGALTKMLGSKVGGAVGKFIPFGGEILGSLMGSLIGKLFGPTAYETRERQASKDITGLWGGLDKQFGGAGGGANALSVFGYNASDIQGYKGAGSVEPLRKVFDELLQKQKQFNGDLGDTLTKIDDLGGSIPEALRPYLDALKDGKILTQENIDLIAQMSGDGQVDFGKMEEAANRYGISIDGLGQAFKDDKMHKSWQQIIDDMDLLERGGADMNAVLDGMQDEIQTLVQQSIDFGTTIPANMKPWIQKLIDSGKLLGANGEAIKDINTLSFGDTMQTSLEKLNATLKELIDTLRIKLPAAAREGADGVTDALDDIPGPGEGGRPGKPGRPPSDDDGRPPSASYVGGMAVIQIDGRVVAQAVVPRVPGVVRSYRLA